MLVDQMVCGLNIIQINIGVDLTTGEHESVMVTPLQLQVFRAKRFYCWGFAGAALVMMVSVRWATYLQAGTREHCTSHGLHL